MVSLRQVEVAPEEVVFLQFAIDALRYLQANGHRDFSIILELGDGAGILDGLLYVGDFFRIQSVEIRGPGSVVALLAHPERHGIAAREEYRLKTRWIVINIPTKSGEAAELVLFPAHRTLHLDGRNHNRTQATRNNKTARENQQSRFAREFHWALLENRTASEHVLATACAFDFQDI